MIGYSANNEICKRLFPGALILDDICESHGCRNPNGTKRGSDSLGASFSFYFGHHMTTIEGGMVSTNNYELYDLMRMKRSHGLARESENFDFYTKKYKDISKQFLFVTDGYNFRNHEICAVLGIKQLKRLDSYILKRNMNFLKFIDLISEYEKYFYIPKINSQCSNFCFPLITKNNFIAQELRLEFDNNGIEHRPIISGNLLKQPFLEGHKITTNKKVYLIWILSVITFFFSAVLDNLTTAIVMAALLPKLIKDKETLWLFAGVLILAANAGGAWSPIGDVTTIMLWIGGQVSAANIVTAVIVPSIVKLPSIITS